MRFPKVSSVVVALGVAACNPSTFNSALDHAPVVDTNTGGAITNSLFILPLPPLTGSPFAARAVITKPDLAAYLAMASYDGNGKVTLSEDKAAEAAVGSGIYSVAVREDGTLLLGVPRYLGGSTPPGAVMTATAKTEADGTTTFAVAPVVAQGGGHLGISVASGNITGLPGGDFVALSNTGVHLLPPNNVIPAPFVCQDIPLDPPRLESGGYGTRPIVVADLMTGGADEIVLGGRLNNQGVVSIFQYVSGALRCPAQKKLTLGSSIDFGTSLAVGDFDGDGVQDLAVGTPPDRVLVYFGPLENATDPAVTISAASSTGFGRRIAPFYVRGMASAQLLVADSSARGGQGEIRLFSVTRTSAAVIATLFNSKGSSDSGWLGTSLGTLPFEGGICNPAAGSKIQAIPFASAGPQWLTFFTFNAGATVSPDPRCFAQPK